VPFLIAFDPVISRAFRFIHRTARMQFLRTDRHFSAETELAAVGKAGAGVDVTTMSGCRTI
jgi:hypothetical protein